MSLRIQKELQDSATQGSDMSKKPKILRKYKTILHGQEVEVSVYEEDKRNLANNWCGPFDWVQFIESVRQELEEDLDESSDDQELS